VYSIEIKNLGYCVHSDSVIKLICTASYVKHLHRCVLSVRIVEVINCWLRIVFSVNCQLACFQQLCLNVTVFINCCVFDGTVLLTASRSRVKHDLCTQEVCHVLGIE